jgi:glutathione S-transferase
MEQTKSDTKPAIKLFQGPPVYGLPWSPSPPCMKLTTWLRMAGVPYELGPFPSMTQPPPKGKIPYIEDDGALIGDSTLIIEHLKRTRAIDLDLGLTKVERAIGLAFRRMLKENTYWLLMHIRYEDDANWPSWRRALASSFVPKGAPDAALEQALAIVDGIRKLVHDYLHAQGLGRHTVEEIHQIGSAEVMAVSDFLGDKPFFFGDKPTGTDATVYTFMAQLIELPFDSPTTKVARGQKNLVDYCGRMRARFFS